METHCIANPEIGLFLKREQRADTASYELNLRTIFCDILERAHDFVPSEAGSIFLVDPDFRRDDPNDDELVAIACFGEASERLVGQRFKSSDGIIGHAFQTGRAYISSSPQEDPFFFDGVDDAFRFKTRSVVCAPLTVEGEVIGVLELLNHRSGQGYRRRDLELLEIFAQTISASMVNAIDAQRAKEMAKRDDLTGLFNDRFLHHCLSTTTANALAKGEDCGLVFLDLDHFKGVNDVHGHLAGSRLLSEVGIMLRQILPGPAIPARYGGDEFVIVVPGVGREEIFWVAETVRKNIESKVFLEDPDPADPVNYPALCIKGQISCSVGITTLIADVLPALDGNGEDPVAAKNELLRQSDVAMYRAKEGGRNRTVAAWDIKK